MHGYAVQPRGVPAETGLAQFLQTPSRIFSVFAFQSHIAHLHGKPSIPSLLSTSVQSS